MPPHAFWPGATFPTLGVRSPIEPFAPLVNALPDWALDQLYIWSGASEAAPADRMANVRAEHLSAWVAGEYPSRQYPAAFVGSSNGALVHLACALGAPFLPQTFLIPVRRSVSTPTIRPRTWPGVASPGGPCSTPTPSCSCTTCTTPTRIGS